MRVRPRQVARFPAQTDARIGNGFVAPAVCQTRKMRLPVCIAHPPPQPGKPARARFPDQRFDRDDHHHPHGQVQRPVDKEQGDSAACFGLQPHPATRHLPTPARTGLRAAERPRQTAYRCRQSADRWPSSSTLRKICLAQRQRVIDVDAECSKHRRREHRRRRDEGGIPCRHDQGWARRKALRRPISG